MTGFDVVVVGGGTAGCVLAARLSEDPARRVLLLEAGVAPRSLAATPSALLDARRVPGAEPDSPHNRWFPVRLIQERPWRVSRGQVLGGSSATNGAYFVRARPEDFARWSAHGDEAWAWKRVLPLLRRLERDLDFGGRADHGSAGPVPVARRPLTHPAAAAFGAAAAAVGHSVVDDANGADRHGVGPMPSDAVHGVRWSTATAYLLDAVARPNLTVRGGVRVDRVLIRHGRAVGVEGTDGDAPTTIEADAVVLAAGALVSPAILLRSGVGPAADLRGFGIPVVLDAGGVGAGLSDHPQVTLRWRPRVPLPRPADGWTGGLLTVPDGDADVEVLQSLVPLERLTGDADLASAPLPLLVSVHAPVAPGSFRLGGAELEAEAVVDQGFLRTAEDRRRLRDAVRLTAEVVLGGAFASVSAGFDDLDPATLRDDRALDDWVRGRLETAFHTCATVPFRLPDGSPGPVDQWGAVRGIEGLHVADTSILPTTPLRGPANTAVLIGELVADHLRTA